MDTESYCATLDKLDSTTAIRAIHQAYLQLRAIDKNCDCKPYDNKPAIDALANALRVAGHMGF